MRRVLFLFPLLAVSALGQEQPKVSRVLWWSSVASVAAANVADISSSWQRPEVNPLLRDARGNFSCRGAAIKSGMAGGVILAEYMLVRRKPRAAKILSCVNFGISGFTLSVALRNWRIR